MSKPIRISNEVYSRLENLRDGFDTPSDTILKILNDYEYTKSYKIINDCVRGKIAIFIEEKVIKDQTINVLMHYCPQAITSAIQAIIQENKNYGFNYQLHPIGITIDIFRH
ncbi:MAG: hypothetical protein EOO69_02985 [Moraxellaceae bacterium]|nr:MAG: hypothetical protein EOO69_02985 [Moraxellaceae bacterium]